MPHNKIYLLIPLLFLFGALCLSCKEENSQTDTSEEDTEELTEEIQEEVVVHDCDQSCPPFMICQNGVCVDSPENNCEHQCHTQGFMELCFDVCPYQLPEPKVCPGSSGCEDGSGPLLGGVATRVLTPSGFELPREEYMNNEEFVGDILDDETFFDCGLDQLCEGDPEYPGPDQGEGDGIMQGVWIAGYGYSRPAKSVHDDLWARTVVFEQGDQTVALVAVDFVGFFYDDLLRTKELLKTDLEIDHLMIAATHNHEGCDMAGQWGPGDGGSDLPLYPGWTFEYKQFVFEQISASVVEAYENRIPVTLTMAKADTGYSGYVNDGRDPIIFDDDLMLLQLNSQDDGHAVATIVNWSNHPEVLDDRNHAITSDFPHFLREAMENGIPQLGESPAIDGLGAPCIYFNGSVGGIIGPGHMTVIGRDGESYSEPSFDKAMHIGYNVAAMALSQLQENPVEISDPNLSFGTAEFFARVDNVQFHTALFGLKLFNRAVYGYDLSQPVSENNMPHTLTRVSIIRLGELTLFTVPGELFPELAVGFADEHSFGQTKINPDNPNPPDLDSAPEGPFLKEIVPGEHIFLIGLGNDELGYIVPPYDFKLHESAPYFDEAPGDHYEETNSTGIALVPVLFETISELSELLRD